MPPHTHTDETTKVTEAEDRRRFVIFGSILRSQMACAAIVIAGVVHVTLKSLGFAGWPCPIHATVGIPCPGCGLGRAAGLILHGHLREAVLLHAFAPVLLLALSVLTTALLLPAKARERLAATVAGIEQRTRISMLLLLMLLFYWVCRFALDGPLFLQVGAQPS